MQDPHVEALGYRLVPDDPQITFRSSPEVTWTTPVGTVRIVGSEAIVALTQHHATDDAARGAIDPYLHAWEIDAGLNAGFPVFHFRFVHARLVDRAVPAEGSLGGHASVTLSVAATLSVEVPFDRYPAPPVPTPTDADIEAMWAHWKQFRQDRESLPSMASFCLTVLENRMILEAQATGSRLDKGPARQVAATAYGIELDILATVGELAAEVGLDPERRKAHAKDPADRRDFTKEERAWLEAVAKEMIRRAVTRAHNPGTPVTPGLTMGGLPQGVQVRQRKPSQRKK